MRSRRTLLSICDAKFRRSVFIHLREVMTTIPQKCRVIGILGLAKARIAEDHCLDLPQGRQENNARKGPLFTAPRAGIACSELAHPEAGEPIRGGYQGMAVLGKTGSEAVTLKIP